MRFQNNIHQVRSKPIHHLFILKQSATRHGLDNIMQYIKSAELLMFSLTILKLNACSRLENINDVVTCTYTRGRDCLHFTSTCFHHRFLVGSMLLIFLVFSVVFLVGSVLLLFFVFCVVFLVRSVLIIVLVFCVVFFVGSVLLIFLVFCVVFWWGLC